MHISCCEYQDGAFSVVLRRSSGHHSSERTVVRETVSYATNLVLRVKLSFNGCGLGHNRRRSIKVSIAWDAQGISDGRDIASGVRRLSIDASKKSEEY